MKHLKRISGSAFVMLVPWMVGCSVPDFNRGENAPQMNKPIDIRSGLTQAEGSNYAGSQTCETCHNRIYHQWAVSAHARKLTDEAHFSPPHQGSCNRCHATADSEPRVGCEACHGPMALHAEYPEALEPVECRICDIQKMCIKCHNRSIDPDFDAKNDWALIDHGKNEYDPIE